MDEPDSGDSDWFHLRTVKRRFTATGGRISRQGCIITPATGINLQHLNKHVEINPGKQADVQIAWLEVALVHVRTCVGPSHV